MCKMIFWSSVYSYEVFKLKKRATFHKIVEKELKLGRQIFLEFLKWLFIRKKNTQNARSYAFND